MKGVGRWILSRKRPVFVVVVLENRDNCPHRHVNDALVFICASSLPAPLSPTVVSLVTHIGCLIREMQEKAQTMANSTSMLVHSSTGFKPERGCGGRFCWVALGPAVLQPPVQTSLSSQPCRWAAEGSPALCLRVSSFGCRNQASPGALRELEVRTRPPQGIGQVGRERMRVGGCKLPCCLFVAEDRDARGWRGNPLAELRDKRFALPATPGYRPCKTLLETKHCTSDKGNLLI